MKDVIKTIHSVSEITYEHLEQDYIEFIYCLWKGVIQESKYFMSGKINKSMRQEALDVTKDTLCYIGGK